MTNHGLLIQVAGKAIGAITSWSTNQAVTVTPVFEFGPGLTVGGGDDVAARRGEMYENVIGNSNGTTINIRRYDIYTARFENIWPNGTLEMLSNQNSSIKLVEFFKTPQGTLDFSNIYYGFFFTSLGREHSADGNRIVMANASGTYARIRPVR